MSESQSETKHSNYSQSQSPGSGSSHGVGVTHSNSGRPMPWVSGKWGIFPLWLTEFTAKAFGRNGGEFEVRHLVIQQQYSDRETGEKRFSTNLKPEHVSAVIALLEKYEQENAIRTVVLDGSSFSHSHSVSTSKNVTAPDPESAPASDDFQDQF